MTVFLSYKWIHWGRLERKFDSWSPYQETRLTMLIFDSKKIPPWLFRAVVDVPIVLRQQVDIMEDRTSPVTVGHCFLEVRFKEQRRINFQAGFTNWSPWNQRWVTLPCWTSCCRPGSPHRSCSATAASWCVRSSWNHDFQQTAKLEPKI